MEVYKIYIKNIGFVGITLIIARVKGLILLPILTRTLGPESYGILALILTSVSLLVPICTLKLEYAIIRFLGPEKDIYKVGKGIFSILGTTLSITIVISFIIFILSKTIAISFFNDSGIQNIIKISISLIFLTVIDQILLDYFRGINQIKKYSTISIIQTIGEIILTAYLVLSGYGLFGAILSLIISKILVTIIGFFWMMPQVKFSHPSFLLVKSYLSFSLPLVPVAIGHLLINFGDRYVIGYFMNTNAVGIYSAAYSLGLLLSFFYAPIPIVLFPTITTLYENNRINELKNHLEYSLKFFLMLSIPSLFGLSILSKSILTILTTPEFTKGFILIPILASAYVFYNCSDIGNLILILFKKTKMSAIVHGLSAGINVLLNIILIPIIGILGAAIATLVTFILHFIIIYKISYKLMPFHVDIRFIIKSITASFIMVFVIWKMEPLSISNILISILVGTLVYFGGLFLLKGISKKEFELLKKNVKR